MLLCLLEGMQSDAGPSGACVAPLVEQCPDHEPHLPSLIPLFLHMLREEGSRQKGRGMEDRLGNDLWKEKERYVAS